MTGQVVDVDLLQNLTAFYEHAFDRMVWELGAIGGIVAFVIGFVIPFVVNRIQKRQFAIESEKVIGQLETKVNELKQLLQKDIVNIFSTEKDKIENILSIEVNNSRAAAFHLQAQIHQDKNRYSDEFSCGLYGMQHYLMGSDHFNLRHIFALVQQAFDAMKGKSQLGILKSDERMDVAIQKVLKELGERNVNSQFDDLRMKIKSMQKEILAAK